MKILQSHLPNSSIKQERSRRVLLELVALYLKEGKPVGSETLRKEGLLDFSSSSLRNYFSELEELGYLKQQHTSAGRIPTNKGIKFYAEQCLVAEKLYEEDVKALKELERFQKKEVAYFLQSVAEGLSAHTGCAVFFVCAAL